MIQCAFYLTPDGELLDQLGIEQIKGFLATGEGLLWVDMEDVTNEDAESLECIPFPSPGSGRLCEQGYTSTQDR